MEAIFNKLFEAYLECKKDNLEMAVKEAEVKEAPYQSENIQELAAALSKAQGEYEIVGNNRENPYFKSRYADFAGIMKAVKKALAKNGLSFVQQLRMDNGATILHSILMHSSGQWMESRVRIVPLKNDPQTFGSTLTYNKRYAAEALLCIIVDDDAADDDAEVAMVPAREVLVKGPSTKYNPKEESHDTISKQQLEELEYELAEYPDLAEHVMEKLKIRALADMKQSQYRVSLQRIREIKQLRNEGVKPN